MGQLLRGTLMTRRALPTLALALFSAASAYTCPNQPGHMLNGLLPATTLLRPDCGKAYQNLATLNWHQGTKPDWIEVYTGKDDDAIARALTTILKKLRAEGYQGGKNREGNTLSLAFSKRIGTKTSRVVMSIKGGGGRVRVKVVGLKS